MGRTWMSKRELRRVEVLSGVKEGELQLVDAAELIGVGYRQAKRLWKRYRQEGPPGLQQRSAGRESNRAKPKKFRERVLRLVRKKYGGEEGQRFGPTLAAEHLESDAGLTVVDAAGRPLESAAAAPAAPWGGAV
ncbi:MAG: helix-turn-helix domain-containing protein [bacterium]|nr:helix-turn-helix domain-containing protein [bacterium]